MEADSVLLVLGLVVSVLVTSLLLLLLRRTW
jgi:hypothetical protein